MLGLTAGAVLISFSGVLVKVAHVTPNVSVFYRVFIGAVVLLAAALFRGEIKRPAPRYLLQSQLCGHFIALYHW